MSMTCLLSGKDHGLARTARQATRVFVLLLALGAATQSSLGTPPLEQTRFDRVTCFLDEIHHPQAGKIAQATVFIAAVWPDGTLASEGTGVFEHRGGTPPINCRKILSCRADLPLGRGPDRRRLGPLPPG